MSFVTGLFGVVHVLAAGYGPGGIAVLAAGYAIPFALAVTHARRRGPAAPCCGMASDLGMLIDARIVLLVLALAALVTASGPYGRDGGILVMAGLMIGGGTDGVRWGMLAHRLGIPIRAVRPLLQRALR